MRKQEVYIKITEELPKICNHYWEKVREFAMKLQKEYISELYMNRGKEYKYRENEIHTSEDKMKDKIVEFILKAAKEMLKECNDKLIYYTDDPGKIMPKLYKPNFTMPNFEAFSSENITTHGFYGGSVKGKTRKDAMNTCDIMLAEHYHGIIVCMIDEAASYMFQCQAAYTKKMLESLADK